MFKLSHSFFSALVQVISLFLLLFVAACGQKGPLYLPDQEQAVLFHADFESNS